MRIFLILSIAAIIFMAGFFTGSNKTKYDSAIATVQAVDKTLKQERAKQDVKDKELAEANKRISELRALNERVQCSPNKASGDLQSCERERIRLRELTKRCSSTLTRYIEATDKLLIERR